MGVVGLKSAGAAGLRTAPGFTNPAPILSTGRSTGLGLRSGATLGSRVVIAGTGFGLAGGSNTTDCRGNTRAGSFDFDATGSLGLNGFQPIKPVAPGTNVTRAGE